MNAPDDATTPISPAPAEREPDLTVAFAQIVALEAVIILLLWWFGRAFS
jgi:hypothetical protein